MKRTLFNLLISLVLVACTTTVTEERADWSETGISEDGFRAYLGIEYARAERWTLPTLLPPNPADSSFETLGPACPQDNVDVLTERCLYLNVFTPDGSSASSEHPVLVWIHGGGFRSGRGDARLSFLAKSGIVVVTFNYRLGALGFHDKADWPASAPRNFGQADMVKALEWVNANIRSFGGDPDNITLGGHSAGGMGVQLMMVDPRARGLFHRAFSDAGYGTWPFPTASKSGDEMSGVDDQELTPYSITELVAQTPFFHLPYVGASDLPKQPIEAFRDGDQALVPYMAGANSFDGFGTLQAAGFTPEPFYQRYRSEAEVSSAYSSDEAVSTKQAAERLFGDMRYVFASEQTVKAMAQSGQPAYMFYFDHPMGAFPGTPHGGHYRLVLENKSLAFTTYLKSFINTGAPFDDDLPIWPTYSEEMPSWMVFSPDPELMDAPLKNKMGAISKLTFPASASVTVPETD